MKHRSKSRKRTPWDNKAELTATQEYVHMHYVARYEERHTKLKDDCESKMINSYKPAKCPYCSSENFIQIAAIITEIPSATPFIAAALVFAPFAISIKPCFKRYVRQAKRKGEGNGYK